MWKTLATSILCVSLLGCAAREWRAEQPYPSREELIGVYFWGDGMGANEVMELRADGTYKQTIVGHLTPGNTDLYGQWRVKDKHVFFYTRKGVYPADPDDLTYAETFYYKDKPAFVRAQDLKQGKVFHWWVYTWQSRPDA